MQNQFVSTCEAMYNQFNNLFSTMYNQFNNSVGTLQSQIADLSNTIQELKKVQEGLVLKLDNTLKENVGELIENQHLSQAKPSKVSNKIIKKHEIFKILIPVIQNTEGPSFCTELNKFALLHSSPFKFENVREEQHNKLPGEKNLVIYAFNNTTPRWYENIDKNILSTLKKDFKEVMLIGLYMAKKNAQSFKPFENLSPYLICYYGDKINESEDNIDVISNIFINLEKLIPKS